MATIENFATIRYTSGGITATKVSNLAEISLESSVRITKSTLGDTYSENSVLTYIITVTNTTAATINDITITDDLGTFAFNATELTPLSYTSPALLLIDGQDNTAQLSVDTATAGSLVFSFPSLTAGATANIIYKVTVNEYAALETGSTIVNTATLSSTAECVDGEATATVQVADMADVSVFKQMCPNPVVCGSTVTYTIRVYNYGNLAAENVELTDNFDPAPTNVTVSRDGILLPATDYTYVDGLLTVPSTGGSAVSVPPATFTRDPVSGVVSVTPGVVEYVITGTI